MVIRDVEDKIWLVSFMDYDLGFFDQDENSVEPVGVNPFAPKVLPMSPKRTLWILELARGIEPPTG